MQSPIQFLPVSPTLSIGSVTGGDEASASLFGPPGSMVLNLVLPRGEPGLPGLPGTNGTDGVGKTWVVLTATDYAALTDPERADTAKVYFIPRA